MERTSTAVQVVPTTSQPAPLRVWLEPGYDHGRVGAWLLDLPGAFGWALSRAAAVSQAPASAGWFRDWLAGHGDDRDPIPAIAGREVVEEVPATVVDGNERNATFAADHEQLSAEELEAVIRRLRFARDDMLVLAEHVRAFESSNGPLPPEDAEPATSNDGDTRIDAIPGRSAQEVLRHVADVEVWLGSRLDSAARYANTKGDTSDITAHLNGSREWAIENLRALQGRGVPHRTDSKGESWTVRKVARRYLYHSTDHLRELDRRLARAEHRTDRLEVRLGHLRDPMPLARLLRSVGWDHRTNAERLSRALAGTYETAEAWDGDRIVAFARSVSDGAMTGIVATVAVDPAWQGLGLATKLVRMLIEDRPEVAFHLAAAAGVTNLYEGLGFELEPNAMIRRRRKG